MLEIKEPEIKVPQLKMQQVNKQQIAAAFSRAAGTYDPVAHLQRAVGKKLLELAKTPLQQIQPLENWLDLGCGTGYFCQILENTWPQAEGIGLDLAEGMLKFAQTRCPNAQYLCADAEQLPLATSSQDLVFSSLALQWCSNLSGVLNEVKRVLKPGGLFLFSSVAEGSLFELNQSWQAVDSTQHVNNFRSFKAYQTLLEKSNLELIQAQNLKHTCYYQKVQYLTQELKELGADSIQTGRNSGLMGRNSLQRLLKSYESYRQPEGLPASWQIVYGVLRNNEH